MEKSEILELYDKAISKWGHEAQLNMLFEECGELLSAIGKLKRGRCDKYDVITELADVSIMVEQMAVLFGHDEYVAEKARKLMRLKERLDK